MALWHYGDINLVQHWLRQWIVSWWHQAITWTNVDISSERSGGIHLSAILQEIPQSSVTEISFKMTYLKFCSNLPGANELTHWGRVTHICVSNLTTIGSDNGLSPDRRQAIIWTNAGILLIGPLGTNFNEISIEIHTFSFKKIFLKLLSGKWRRSCLGLNVLNVFCTTLFGHLSDVKWCQCVKRVFTDRFSKAFN